MDVGPTSNRKNPTQKRVLVIAYYWPPAGGPGVQRWLKFVKYLPQHGWTPTVVVPKNAAYPVLDPSLQDDVATDLNVISAPIFEPYEAVLRLLKRKDAERLGSTGNKKSGSINKLMLQNRSKSGRYAIPGKAFEYLALAKPMLNVTPKPSDLDDLATQWGCITIGYDDEREALQKIEALEFQSKPSDEVRMAFTRATLTGQLSEALNKLTSLNP
jgi:hypothetical protein